jgi:hypothetical protein
LIKSAVDNDLSRLLDTKQSEEPSPGIVDSIQRLVNRACPIWFDKAVVQFNKVTKKFIKTHGGNEDSTLKNTAFVKMLGENWPKKEAVANKEG